MPVAHGLSGLRFPAHPHRQPDELLSSWVTRTAYANHLKVQSFITVALGRHAAILNRDMDRSAKPEQLERLSAQTGSSLEEVRGGMLSAYEGQVFSRHNPNGMTPWILPLGVYHRTRRRYGMQFCPLCLFWDKEPYYRRRWRLAFATICDEHGTLLHDRCPKCGAPVVYFRNDLGRRVGYRLGDLVSCSHCDFDLRRAEAAVAPCPDWKSYVALRSLVTFPDLGWWWADDAKIQYSHLYFDVLLRVLHVLRTDRHGKLAAALNAEAGWTLPRPKGSRDAFELKDVRDRHAEIMAALWLLADWPDRFISVCKSARLHTSYVLGGLQFPYWFQSVIKDSLASGRRSATAEEARSAATYLEQSGRVVSAQAVAELVGSRGVDVAKPYTLRRQTMTDADFDKGLAWFDAAIQAMRPKTKYRLTLQRDRAMYRLVRITGWKASDLIGLTVRDAIQITMVPKGQRDFPDLTIGILLSYLAHVRRYLAGDTSGEALFIGWRQGGITENAFREGLRKRSPLAGVELLSVLW